MSASTLYSYTTQAIDTSTNASGQSTAAIVTTPAILDTTAPTVPAGLVATVVSLSEIDLSWSASTDNVAVTGYRIRRNGALLLDVGNVTTYQDRSLIPSFTYIYTVQAFDVAGNVSGQSGAVSGTTLPAPDTVPPTAPTNLAASAVSPFQVDLTWTAATDNVVVASYRVYRDGVLVANVGGTTYQDTGRTPTTSYTYNVDAVDGDGNASPLSTSSTVTTPVVPDTVAPSTPASLTATAVSASQINLAWSASSDNVAVTGYRVFRNGTLLVTLGSVLTYQDAGLSAATAYSYRVRALDAAGNVSGQSSAASATTQAAPDSVAPSTPANLSATAASASQINLSWTASTDNVAVTGYHLYRNGVFLAALGNVIAYSDNGLAASTMYTYNLDARDAAGNASGLSSSASATTQASGGAPGTPSISGVSGTLVHGQAVTISGTAFGSKSHPGPMLWDNFEGGSNGAVLANDSVGAVPPIHQGALAGYSQWERDGGGNFGGQSIVYNNSAPRPNSALHVRSVFNSSGTYGLELYVPYSQFTTGKELYISYYYRMTKTGAAYPRQTKSWVVYDSSWQDKLYWSTAYNNCESGSYRTHITELGPQEHLFSTGGVNVNGEWVRFESYLKQSGPNVSNGTWEQAFYRPSLGSPSKEFYSVTNQKLRNSSADFVRWTFGGSYFSMCGSSDTGTVDVDDFYMDDSRARVEVCDAATWSASKRCELQVPTAWSDTSITATFNKGYLDSSKPAYVYVIEPGGNVNASGFAVTLP